MPCHLLVSGELHGLFAGGCCNLLCALISPGDLPLCRLLEGHVPEPKRIEHADLPPPKPLWHDDNRGRRVRTALHPSQLLGSLKGCSKHGTDSS